tara:strand:+ start:1114 stop:2091 length:978 start_codon:yes stop_codon:yes gene_type:complete
VSFKNNVVIVVTAGNSGGGAIHDYLLCRNDFVSPFQGEEFRLITDPYGLENLHLKLIENFSLNNSSEAFHQFKKYCFFLKNLKSPKTNKLIYGKKFYKLSVQYLSEIKKLSYKGIPQFKSISLKTTDKVIFYLKKKFLGYKNHEHGLYKMSIPVDNKKFFLETKKYLIKIFKNNINNISRKNIILDQATNYWKPEVTFKYFNNQKIIIVTRDPRSIYYSMKSRMSYAYPGYDVKKFVIWYREILKKREPISKKNNHNIIEIQFENFVSNFEKEKKKLEKFLKLKPQNVTKFDFKFTKNNMLKAKENLGKKDLKYIEKNLSDHLQW